MQAESAPPALLVTKLSIPPARPTQVARSRLVERLDNELSAGRRLALVCAPAGFGKTTLVSEWAHQRKSVAWVSLDAGDNDPVRFWTYIVAALRQLHPDIDENILGPFRSSQPLLIETVPMALVNALAATQNDTVLVLDDYHVIEAEPIHQGVTLFLERLPPHARIVIASRVDPPLPLGRLRARSDLVELRAADLRFTPHEARGFLKDVMGLDLSVADVAALESRTEGWVAGLQLAALSVQGLEGRDELAEFVRSFTGSNRHVVDYLAEEVLRRQPPEIQTFLLQTSVLQRLSGSLCNTVTGRGDSQELLEELERENIFVVPLDHDRRWYRYHHLFGDLLWHRLTTAHPEWIPGLRRRAATWYEDHGMGSEAIRHALASRDYNLTAHLIMAHVDDTLARGEIATVQTWLDALPDTVVLGHPGLSLSKAQVLYLVNRLESTEALLDAAERGLRSGADALSEKDKMLLGEALTMRGYLAHERGEHLRAVEMLREGQAYIPPERSTARGVNLMVLGYVLLTTGETPEAARVNDEAVSLLRAGGNVLGAVMATGQLAIARASMGQLHLAKDIVDEAFSWVTSNGLAQVPAVCVLHIRLADILREQSDLEGAEHHLATAIELARASRPLFSMRAYALLAMVKQAQGEEAGALAAMSRAEEIARGWESPLYAFMLKSQRARLALAQGDLPAAVRWMQTEPPPAEDGHELPSILIEHQVATRARLLIARGRQSPSGGLISDALALVGQLRQMAMPGNRQGVVLEAHILEALAWDAQRDADRSLASLELALAIAESEGYVRTFLDEGAPMVALLVKASRHRPASSYVHHLLAHAQRGSHKDSLAKPAPTGLAEPLSERELEVLRLVAQGLTNQEIAERLFVSVGTAKKHIEHIHGKLGVSSRTQAVARARALDLL